MNDQSAVAHYYRMFRGNMERTAESAYHSARSHVYFRRRLAETLAVADKRSKAAKRGHKTRLARAR